MHTYHRHAWSMKQIAMQLLCPMLFLSLALLYASGVCGSVHPWRCARAHMLQRVPCVSTAQRYYVGMMVLVHGTCGCRPVRICVSNGCALWTNELDFEVTHACVSEIAKMPKGTCAVSRTVRTSGEPGRYVAAVVGHD